MHYACHANISLIINLTIGPLAPAVAQRGRGGRGQARGSGHGPKRSQCRQTCSASSWLPVLWWSRSRQSTAAIHPESSPWYALCSSHAETPWPGLLIIFFFSFIFTFEIISQIEHYNGQKDRSWQEVTSGEMKKLITLLNYIGLDKVGASIDRHWTIKLLYHGLWARAIMARTRHSALRLCYTW